MHGAWVHLDNNVQVIQYSYFPLKLMYFHYYLTFNNNLTKRVTNTKKSRQNSFHDIEIYQMSVIHQPKNLLFLVFSFIHLNFSLEKFICQLIYLGPLCIEPIKWNETDSHKSKEHNLIFFHLNLVTRNFQSPIQYMYCSGQGSFQKNQLCQVICARFCCFVLDLVAFPSWTFCFV